MPPARGHIHQFRKSPHSRKRWLPVSSVASGLRIRATGSTLADRGVYTSEGLRVEHLRQIDPTAFEDEMAAGYIKGVMDEAPSVITLNTRAASALLNEFLARTYPFRQNPNRNYARSEFSLAACDEDYHSEDKYERQENPLLGRGDAEPLLGLPQFRKPRKDAA
ncbi:hypothetical protein ACQKGC_23845 [Allorhizobium pseudoryzae]|uniref:hypothetical protein n=1 Tax=Allorhizobium pseudoryzae TaxID=379684 RepID=UPI003D0020AD